MIHPPQLDALQAETRAAGFPMASDEATGTLLRTLAASKPGGRVLELGTGTGLATAWLLAGLDDQATLLSVDNDPGPLAIARSHLDHDPRVTLVLDDGAALLARLAAAPARFDLVFADTWPGKYTHLDMALGLLASGGLFVVDDMLPQPNWPDGHGPRAAALAATLQTDARLAVTRLDWSTGLIIAARVVSHTHG